MNKITRILLIEDNPGDIRLVREALAEAGASLFDLTAAFDLASGLAHLASQPVDAILLDPSLPDSTDFDTFSKVHEQTPQVPIILLTGADDDVRAAQAIREGAQDYLVKSQVNSSLLVRSLQYAIERKRAEEALRENEVRYRSIFEGVEDAIFVETPEGRILDVNRRACEMFGYTREQFLTRTVYDLVPSKDYIVAFNPEHPSTFPLHPLETVNVRANGEQFPIEISIHARKLKEEIVLFVVGRDITERKQSVQALRESEERYRELVENANDIVYTIDLAGKFTSVNRATEHITGYSREEALMLNLAQIVTSDDFERAQQILQSKVSDGAPTTYPMEIYAKDGHKISLELSTRLVYQKGKLVGSQGIARDITERKQAEEALIQSEEKFRLLSEKSITGVYIIQDGKMAYVNPSFATMFGYSPEEINGSLSPKDLIHPDDIQAAMKKLGERLEGKTEKENIAYKGVKKDGSIISIEVYGIPIKYQGRPAAMGTLLEVTARKQAEAALRESEKRFATIFRASPIGICITRLSNGQLVDVNDAFLNLFGYTREEVIGRTTLELNMWPNPEIRNEITERLNSQGKISNLELRISRKSGETGDTLTSSELIDLGGERYMLSLLNDITERKRAEAALAEERSLLTALTDNIPDTLYFKDLESRFLLINNAQARRFGLSDPAQAIGKTDFDFFTEEHARPAYENERAIIQSGQPVVGLEEKETWPDGRMGWVSTTKMPLCDEKGNIVGTFGISRDITERKQAEEALHTSDAQLSNAMKIARLGYWEYDVASDLFTFNDHFYSIFNTTAEREGGYKMPSARYAERFVHPDDRSVVGLEIQKALETTDPHYSRQLEHRIICADGETGHIAVRFFVIKDDQGRTVKTYGANQDITERKRAEEALAHQAEELRQSNEELARLYRASGSLLSGASLSLQELAQTIVGVVQQEFGQANSSLLVIDRDLNELQRLAAAGPYADQVKYQNLALDGPGLIPLAIRTGKVVNAGDVHSAPDYVQGWDAAWSELVIPLKVGGNVIGAIDVQSSEPDAFSPDDERLMAIFAERAALALEHSRLYERTEARVRQLAALRTVDMSISSSFDINLTMSILLDQVRAQLGVDAADILAYNPVTQTFRFSSGQGFRTHALQHTRLRLGEGFAGKAAMERELLKIPDIRADPSAFERSSLLQGENFIAYFGVPLIAKGEIKGVLEVFHREPFILNSDQQAFLEILSGQAGIAMDNAELYERQQRSIADLTLAYNDTLEGWASALELRDRETVGHTRRVTDLTIQLARAVGVKESEQVDIYRGALLHDIGKIGVPDGIVLKPGPLTEAKWEIMRKHPVYAYNMLSPIGYLREALNIPYCHHEHWDGTGYPRGLKGEEIPLAARIFSVVDVWDALTSDRPYRKAWTHEKTRLYIQEQAGRQFDPKVVETFFREVLTR